MSIRVRALWLALVPVVVAVGCDLVPKTNRFDPDAPADVQAPGSLAAQIVLVRPGADDATVEDDLTGVRVGLLDGAGRAVVRGGGPLSLSLQNVSAAGGGTAFIDELPPGIYTLTVAGVDDYQAPNIPTVNLVAGDAIDLGRLTFSVVDDGVGTGKISGEVVGDAGATKTVTLFRAAADGVVEERTVTTESAFVFSGLNKGRYAVVATSAGFAGDHRLDIDVDNDATVTFAGGDALRLRAADEVVVPHASSEVVDVDGTVFVRGDAMTVDLNAPRGTTGVRVSTRPDFTDGEGNPLPFSSTLTDALVALPAREGTINIFAQFEARGAGQPAFVFTAGPFAATVVRDASAPVVNEETGFRLDVDANGVFLANAALGASAPLRIEAQDAISAVAAVGIVVDENATAPAAPSTLEPAPSAAGLVRLDRTVSLGDDGDRFVHIFVADAAGNVSAPRTLHVLKDTTLPQATLRVQNASAGILDTRLAVVHVEAAADVDAPVAVELGAPLSASAELVPFDADLDFVVPAELVDGQDITVEARLFDRVGNVDTVRAAPVELSLKTNLTGVATSQDVPGIAVDHSGTVITARDENGVALATTTTSSTGFFAIAGLSEGRAASLEAARAGWATTTVRLGNLPTQAAGESPLVLEPIALPLLVGNASGIVRRADVLGDLTVHAGSVVSVVLSSPDRRFAAQPTVTSPDGSFSFRNLPATRADENYLLTAARDGYAGVAAQLVVAANANTVVNPDAQGSAQPLLLETDRRAFDVCAPTGPCEATTFFNTNSVRIRLSNDADVAAVRVAVGTRFAATDKDPTFVNYAGDPIAVDIGTVDGEVSLFVQTRDADGRVGDVLEETIIRDTVPPRLLDITRRRAPGAFSDAFTNRTFVDLAITGDAGAGAVAPIAQHAVAFVDVAASLDAAPVAGARVCDADVGDCRVSFPGAEIGAVVEDLYRMEVWTCDAAGNCSAPADAFSSFDITPPSTTNGVSFTLTGDLVRVGSELVSRSTLYGASVNVGIARSGAGDDVKNAAGDNVADVYAVRFSRRENVADAEIRGFALQPEPDTVVENDDALVVPPLPAADGTYRIFAQFFDAAGNRTTVEPNAFLADLRVDTTAPVVALVVDGGAAVVTDPVVTVDIVVPVGGEVPARVDFAADDGIFAAANTVSRNFPLTPGGESFTLPPRGDGSYVVFARVFDAAGNVVERNRTILLDTTPPDISFATCTSCLVRNGQFFSATSTASLNLAVSDASGVAQLEVEVEDLDTGVSTVQTLPFASNVSVSLFANTTNVIRVRAFDRGGNGTAVASATTFAILEDERDPRIVSVALADGATTTRLANVVLRTTAVDDETTITRMQVANGRDFSGVPATDFRAVDFVDLPGVDGSKEVCVRVEDAAGNDAIGCDTVVLDRAAPAGTIDIGPTVTSSTSVIATLTYPSDTTKIAVSTDPIACGAATYVPARFSPEQVTVDVAALEGTVRVFACFEDGAGNVSATAVSDSVVVDRTAPVVSVVLDAGAAFSLDDTVAADVTVAPAADAVGLALQVDSALNCSTATYGAFQASSTVTLPATDATHTVFACVRDAAGNVSAVASDSIVVDRTDPFGTVVINGGALLTKNATVALDVTRSNDVVSMAVSTAALNCTTATYEAFSSTRAVTFSGLDGLRAVNVCLRDGAGRTVLLTDDITLDRRAPTASILINNGAAVSSTSIVNVNATFDTDAVAMAVAAFPLDCNSESTPYKALSASTPLDLQSNGGNATAFACFKDAAGNTTAVNDSILVEQANNGTLVASINGGDPATRTRNVTVSLFAPADATQMKIAEALTLDCDSPVGYVAFQTSSSLVLAAGGAAPAEGTRTVAVCVKTSSSQTLFAVDSILLDTFAPTGSVAINNGAATTARPDVVLTIVKGADSPDIVSFGVAGDSASACQNFEAFSGTRAFSIAGVDGSRTAFVCLLDDGGNTTIVSDAITLDTAAPFPVAVNVADFTTSTTATVNLTFPAADTAQVAVAEGALDCVSTNAYVAAGTPVNLTLSASEGTKTIIACFKDAAGNTSQASDVTTLDLFAPAGTTLINNGDAITTSRNVVLAITASPDTARMALVEGTAPKCTTLSSASFITFTPQPNLTLSAGDGTKSVNVCLEDRAGRRGSALADAIRLDQTAPAGSISVNGGASATNRRDVTVAVTRAVGSEDVVEMAVAEGPLTCNAANLAFGAFQTTVGLTLSAGDGTKTITACLRDGAGNVNTANIAATIALDSTPPVGNVVINGGALGTRSQTVTLTLSTTPAEVGGSRAVANEGIECATATFTPVASFPTTVTHTLSSGDGQKNVFVCFKDAGGNVSVSSASIALDGSDPVGTVAFIDPEGNADGFANRRDVNVRLTLPGENASTSFMAVREASTLDCADPTLTYEPFAQTKALTLSSTLGSHTVAACFKDSASRVTPNALVATATINLDDEAPTVTAFRINGVNAPSVNSLVVTVTVVASPDVTAMALANGVLDCTTATYAPFQSPTQFTLAGTSPIQVSLCVKDAASNVLVTPLTRSVIVDTTAPNGSVTIAGGATFTQTRNVQLTLNTSPIEVNGLRAIANDAIDCNLATFTALGAVLPTNVSQTLSLGDGIKTVFVCYKDATGNVSLATDTIQLDTVDPIGSLAILDPEGNNDGFANQTTLSLALSLSPNETASTTQMAVRETASLNCADPTLVYEAFATSKVVTLSSSQGAKNLAVCFKDASGRVTPAGSVPTASITLDTVAPVATSFTINGTTSPITNTNVVSVDVVASSDVVGMALANGSLNCSTALYGPFNSPVQHTLSGTSPVTVSLCLKDRAGNTSVTGANVRSVVIDTIAPSGSVTINSNAQFSQSRDVTLTLNTTPAETNGQFAVFNDIVDCSTAVFQSLGSLPRNVAHTLSAVDGTKTVFICFKDQAGNVSQASDTIKVDTQDPVGTLTIIDPENNNDGFINRTLFNVALTLPNENPSTSQMSIKEAASLDCSAGTTVYEPFSTTKSIQLVGNTQGVRNLVACFRDEAGRVTPTALVATASAELDNIVPVVTDFTINGVTNPVVSSPVVTIAFVPSADATSMAIANGALDCNAATYTAIQSPIQHTISGSSPVTVSLCVRDRGSNVSATGVNTRQVVQDPNAPQGTVLINDGDSFTTSNTVKLTITTADQEAGVTRAISNTSADCANETFTPFTSPEIVASHELLGGGGTKTVFVCFKDSAGNRSSALDTITLDGDAPVGALSINDPEGDANGFANTRNVTVSINLPGETAATAQMAVREATSINCKQGNLVFENFASTKALTLSAGDGLKTIVACFKDASGNVTDNDAVPRATIVVDTTAPSGSLSISEGSLFGGTHFVNTTAVTVTVSSSDADLAGLAISTSALNCATASFSAFSAVQPLTLPVGEGAKTITACLRDSSGLKTQISKAVTLDTTAPIGTLTLDGGADYTADRDVSARVQSAETTGLKVKVPAVDCTAPFNISSFDGDETRTANIAGAEGTRSVGACFADAAGNATFVSTTINLDLTAPTAISATCASCTSVNGNLFTRGADINSDGSLEAAVLLGDVAAVDTNANGFVESVITKVDLNGDGDFNDTVLGVAETTSHDLSSFVGVPIGAADGLYAIDLFFVDAAGNQSAAFDFDSNTAGQQALFVTLDRTAPSAATVLTLTGRRGDGTTSTTHTTTQNVDLSFNLPGGNDVVAAFVTESATFAGLTARPLTELLGTPFVLSGGDATKTVRARLVDRAGNETTLSSTASITLDTAAPTILSFSLRDQTSGDSVFSNAALVDAVTSVATESGLEMRFVTPDNATDSETFAAFASSSTVTVEDVLAQDGLKSVVVQVRDVARNTASANASITLDRSPPTLTSVSIAGGATATRTQNVTVDVGGANATKMLVTVRDTVASTSTTSPLLGFQTQTLVTLPAGDCASCKEVEVKLLDDAGNESAAVTDSIGLDTVAPAGVSLSLAAGAALTSTTTVATTLTFTAGASEAKQVALGEGIDCATATYAALAGASPDTTQSVTLSADDGTKAVTACFKDTAGNISTAVDSIVLDRAAPSGVTISVAGGATKTRLTSNVPVTVNLPVGLTDVTRIAVADRTALAALDCATATYVALATPTVTFTSSTNEVKTVAACFQDAAGNKSATASTATITLDTTLNAGGIGFTVTGTPSTTATRTSSVTVALTSMAAQQITAVQVSELATFADAATIAVSTDTLSLPFTLSGGDGPKTVRLRLVDDAGNVDTSKTQAITLDTTPPTDPRFANNSVLVNGTGAVTVAALAVQATDAGIGLRTGRPYDLLGVTQTQCEAVETVIGTSAMDFTGGRCQWNGTTAFTFSAAALSEGETRVRVRAVDVAGNVSSEDFFTITKDSTPPSDFTVVGFPADGEIALEWDMPAVDADLAGFRVDYQVNPGVAAANCPATVPYDGDFAAQGNSPVDVGANFTATLTNMPNDVAICVVVSAYDDAGNVRSSSPQSITPYTVAPTQKARLTASSLGIAANRAVGALAARNGFLYIAAAGEGLIEIDVSNEACFTQSPLTGCVNRQESTATLVAPKALLLHGPFAFVADDAASGSNGGLRIFRINEGAAPTELTPISPVGNFPGEINLSGAKALAVDGSRLAVLADAGVALINIDKLFGSTPELDTNGAGSELLGKLVSPNVTNTSLTGTGLAIQGNRLAVGGDSAKVLWDISTPATPTEIANDCTTTSTVRSVGLAGTTLYITNTSDALVACDTSTGTVLSQTSTVRARMTIAGPHLYMAGTGRYEILDNSRPAEGLTFLGLFNAVDNAATDRSAFALDGSRAYYATGDNDGDVYVTDVARVRTVVPEASTAIAATGTTSAAVVGDAYLESFSRLRHIRRDGFDTAVTGTTGTPTLMDTENGTIVGAAGATLAFTRRKGDGSLETPTSVTLAGGESIASILVRYPYVVALQTNGTSTKVATYDLGSLSATPVSIQTLPTTSATTPGQNALTYLDGFVYYAVGSASGTDTNRGFYRSTFDGLTGVLGTPTAMQTAKDKAAGVFASGHRVYFWENRSAVRVVEHVTAPSNFTTNVNTTVLGNQVGGGRPRGVGSTFYMPIDAQVTVLQMNFTTTSTSSVVASGTKRMRLSGTGIGSVDVVGDRVIVTDDVGVTLAGIR